MASEDYATEAQIKRLYAVLHSVGLDPKQWKKDANIASYAKLTRAQCSAYIDEAEAFEAEQKAGSTQPASIATAATITKSREEAEAQKIRQEQGRATPDATTEPAKPATPPTVDELIFKYIDIIARVTVAVEQEDRIPKNEKGYATNWACVAVKDELEKGGNHTEQA